MLPFLSGWNSIATRATRGRISLSKAPGNLPASVGSEEPWTFPPGRRKLATKPAATGFTNTFRKNDGDGARLLQQRTQ